MNSILYTCPFIPAEWIAAHGLRPIRIAPRSPVGPKHGGEMEGVCPYVHAFMESACEEPVAGIVATTVCDQMRRGAEWIERDAKAPVFLLNVPSTWQTASVQRLYADELRRLGRFLTRLGGIQPDADTLARVMREYDGARNALRNARGSASAGQWSRALAVFHRQGRPESLILPEASAQHGIPLAVLGGPLMSDGFGLFDLIEQVGGWIVLDGMETGERTLPAPFDRRRIREDPFSELADAYFGSIPDVSRRPNSELYVWLERELESRDVQGMLIMQYPWCDPWRAEIPRIQEWAAIPTLDLDLGDHAEAPARTMTRIEAFLETLKNG